MRDSTVFILGAVSSLVAVYVARGLDRLPALFRWCWYKVLALFGLLSEKRRAAIARQAAETAAVVERLAADPAAYLDLRLDVIQAETASARLSSQSLVLAAACAVASFTFGYQGRQFLVGAPILAVVLFLVFLAVGMIFEAAQQNDALAKAARKRRREGGRPAPESKS